MKNPIEYYDPQKIDIEKRRDFDEIDKYLANKGLQCVGILRGGDGSDQKPEQNFVVGQYYTVGDDTLPAANHLPDFKKIMDDDLVQLEGYALASNYDEFPTSKQYQICYKKLDKSKFREENPFYHNFRGLLFIGEPWSGGITLYVIKGSPPPESRTYCVGNEKLTEQEFCVVMNEVNLENHSMLDEITMKLLFEKKSERQKGKLGTETNKIYESQVQDIYKFDPGLFTKYYRLLKIRNVIFDISEFYNWLNG